MQSNFDINFNDLATIMSKVVHRLHNTSETVG